MVARSQRQMQISLEDLLSKLFELGLRMTIWLVEDCLFHSWTQARPKPNYIEIRVKEHITGIVSMHYVLRYLSFLSLRL